MSGGPDTRRPPQGDPTRPDRTAPPSNDAEPDVPPQVHEDEGEWADEVREQHIRKENPDLDEAIDELEDLVKRR